MPSRPFPFAGKELIMPGMEKNIDILFQGGCAIAADTGEFSILTDQSEKQGGEGSAPTPFDLFLASLGTCAGIYAKRFLEKHKLNEEGLGIAMHCQFHDKKFHVAKITYDITLPQDFPEKYIKPLIRTVEHCTVKAHLAEPPDFETRIAK